jgi:DnaJ-class molecular chaperone
MVLGVSRTESPARIRSAYRDLARKLHPDVAGDQATAAFQEVAEAYGVLSDPGRRRAYNDELRRVENGDVPAGRVTPPVVTQARPRVSIFDDFEAVHPSAEAMYDRFRKNFTGVGIPKAEHLEGLDIEVVLTPEESRRGCTLPIGVPVFRPCRQCGGSGRDWLFPCLACGQQGTVEDEKIVRVGISAMARSGSILEIPLRGSGIHNFYLRLHVFVEPDVGYERR